MGPLEHLHHRPDALAQADPALGGGLVWGFMARRYERLLPSVFSHVLFYWTVLMMFRLWGPSV